MVDFAGGDVDSIAVALAEIALLAGPAVMAEYARDCEVKSKGDGSPVTVADERAEAIIEGRLRALAPDIPIVAEEAVAAGKPIATSRRFFLVDPLDGTREFIAKNGEFTVNIALVDDGAPISGAVYAPAIDKLWFGGGKAFAAEVAVGRPLPGTGVWRRIRARSAPARVVALASRSHGDPRTESFLSTLDVGERVASGSSIKFCMIAEGRADVYPRFAPTMEWDTGAGDAVLRAAGGVVLNPDGSPLRYAKFAASLRNEAFVAWGDSDFAAKPR